MSIRILNEPAHAFANHPTMTPTSSECVCRLTMTKMDIKKKTIRPIMSFVIKIQWESLSQDQFHMPI